MEYWKLLLKIIHSIVYVQYHALESCGFLPSMYYTLDHRDDGYRNASILFIFIGQIT